MLFLASFDLFCWCDLFDSNVAMSNESRDPTTHVKLIFLNLENIFQFLVDPASGLRLPRQHRMKGVLEINHDAAVLAIKFAKHAPGGLDCLAC